MEKFWGNDTLSTQIKNELEKKIIPPCRLIVDSYGCGGLLFGLEIASDLLGREALNHPDFYISFPVIISDKTSADFIKDFRDYFASNPYCSLSEWAQNINLSKNKQTTIGKREVDLIHEKMFLKPYEGKNKVCLIWSPESLNIVAANKLLKLIEEPPNNTYFILVSEEPEQIIETIISRSNIIIIPPIKIEEMKEKLYKNGVKESNKIAIASSGSWRKALQLCKGSELTKNYEKLWITGLRIAFKCNVNKSSFISMLDWAEEVSKLNRDEQKDLIQTALEIFRSALLINYNSGSVVTYISQNNFELSKLAPFIHSSNALELVDALEKSRFEIKRNANSKILFSNLMIKISFLLNQKED